MTLIPKSFYELERWFDEDFPELISPIENAFPRKLKVSLRKVPRINLYEDKGNLIAEAEMPGLSADDIDIKIEDNVLKIEGSSKKESEEKKKDYYKKEIASTYQSRAVVLPVNVNESKAKAEYKDGILKIIMPIVKSNKEKGKKIKIEKK